MSVCVLAITRTTAPMDLRGAAYVRSTLRVVGAGALAAVIADAPESQTIDTLRAAHYQVIAALAAKSDIAPMQFGAVLEDDAAVEAWLATAQGDLSDIVARVAGCAELIATVTIAVTDLDPPTGEISGGSAYLRAQAARLRAEERAHGRARERARLLIEAVEPFIRAHRVFDVREASDAIAAADAAFLVSREQARYVRDKLNDLADGDVRLSGPWPPFSFCAPLETENAAKALAG